MKRKKSAELYFFACFALFSGINLHAQDRGNMNYLNENIQEIVYIDRAQYVPDHHNSETMFQKCEINEKSFAGNSALKAFNLKTAASRIIVEAKEGIVRDPEVSFDGKKIIFSMRKKAADCYHIYEVNSDGSNLKQLTFADDVTDIDPLYLPDGSIIFSSTREPKYCMCNRHIMCNLFLMDADGANIIQLGNSTLHEAHSALLNDGRVIYDRWEYVDRNFGDAQSLWVVNPDGTKQAIYYGNNTASPGAVIDARAVPGSPLIACIFGSCHDRPWGALALLDRRKGVDGRKPVIKIWPESSIEKVVEEGDPRTDAFDSFGSIKIKYEDPFPLNERQILVSRLIQETSGKITSKMGIYLVGADSTETLIVEGDRGAFDPQPLTKRFRPTALPVRRDFNGSSGKYYIQNVYEGTHMKGVEPGAVKYLRVIESPPKLNWTNGCWNGQGQQAPGMNWTNFENKKILGEVPVEPDGSAYFEVPCNKFVYFQLLDKEKKMIQSMRSGTMVESGEVNGCIGCHEDRLKAPAPTRRAPLALQKKPSKMNGWMGKEAELFSFVKQVQPVFNKNCVSCHDFDPNDRNKLVLAGDFNPYFNASFIDLFVKKEITVVGAGPAAIQQAYSWGTHASKLTKVIDGNHHDVKLTDDEKLILYTWMDINGVYYPTYDSAYPENVAGRCPLNNEDMKRLGILTGMDFLNGGGLAGCKRTMGPQISFDRPGLSPCLDRIKTDKVKYDEALALIAKGGEQLKRVPNGALTDNFIPCEKDKERLVRYEGRAAEEGRTMKARAEGRKVYDK